MESQPPGSSMTAEASLTSLKFRPVRLSAWQIRLMKFPTLSKLVCVVSPFCTSLRYWPR